MQRKKVILLCDGDADYRVFENVVSVRIEDQQSLVQVRFLVKDGQIRERSGPKLWTYIDPGLGLKIGDVVNVPTRYARYNLAVVEKLGDGSGGMQIHKEVNHRLIPEENPFS